MRADRLLSILLLLQVRSRVTARELARRLEVSERTIHRDMEALGAAGVPVVAERGAGGGWGLLDTYRTRAPGLTDAEIQALFLMQPARLLADLGLRGAGEAGAIKLLAALPAVQRQGAEYVRERIHVDGAGWRASDEAAPHLATLQDAIWQQRIVRLRYEREGGAVERRVAPLGLVAKGRVWYLVGAIDGDLRTYRVSRVEAAEITEEPFTRPPAFDLAAYWTAAAAQFVANLPRYPTTLSMPSGLVAPFRAAARFARVGAPGPPDAAGWVVVPVEFEREIDACETVLSFGPEVRVLDPPALRARVIRQAELLLAAYAAEAGSPHAAPAP
jgi:predicted DNA-binding transcriptional regulator YafY